MASSTPPNASSFGSDSAAAHASAGFALGAPPIPSGEWVGGRYRILRVLGQGGFGRTYLAKDSQRFDETCVLKEFAPQIHAVTRPGTGFDLDKAQRLFEREAGVLYRLDHPQIPKFRELLQQQIKGWHYLFLVQDYVEGRTFQEWLVDCQGRGLTLSQLDVIQLLRQILPVLDYLHRRGVIHRDISPDNLMQRQRDGLPVLIDFGAVKQAAVTILSEFSAGSRPPAGKGGKDDAEPNPLFQGTRLGKLGYSPPEQMQQGASFPHSDLYALGATALTLLSGLEPQMLMDPHTLEWTWAESLPLQPKFAEFLRGMVALRPSDRYPSAAIALQALERLVPSTSLDVDPSFTEYFAAARAPKASWAPTIPHAEAEGSAAESRPAAPPLRPSQVATVALGQRPISSAGQSVLHPSDPHEPVSRKIARGKVRLLWLGILGLFGGLALGFNQLPFAIEISRRNTVDPPSKLNGTEQSEAVALGPSSSELRRLEEIAAKRSALGISTTFFEQLLTEQFVQAFPERQERPLTQGDADVVLRAEQQGMAQIWLERLALLGEQARSRLGQYGEQDLQAWNQSLDERGMDAATFRDLVDEAFRDRFLSVELPAPGSALWQVWLALADEQAQIIAKQGVASALTAALSSPKPTTPTPQLASVAIDAAGNGYRRAMLQPGQRSINRVSLQQGQSLRVSLDSSDLTALSLAIYAPGSEATVGLEGETRERDHDKTGSVLLLPGDRKSNWEGTVPRTGSYELVIASQAAGPLEYGLTLVVETVR